MIFLQAGDVIELAMQVERSGETFYRAVAQKSSSARLRDFFGEMAGQEVKHFQTFSRMADVARDKPYLTDEEWEQYKGYIQSTVQSAFFEGPERALALAETVSDEEQAIHMAISFEKETLLFFYDLRDLVTGEARQSIQDIVDEEKSHIRRLAAML